MKNILHRFIKDQTHFGMPGGAKMNLALNELREVDLHSNSGTTSKHAPQVERNYSYCMQNSQMENHR